MKLAKMLMEWASEIGMHDPGNEPCRCDVCQRLVPEAIKQEQELAGVMGRWIASDNSAAFPAADEEMWEYAKAYVSAQQIAQPELPGHSTLQP